MLERNYFPAFNELQDSDRFVLFRDRQLLISEGRLLWDRQEIEALSDVGSAFIVIDNSPLGALVAVELSSHDERFIGAELCSLRNLLFLETDLEFISAGKASQVLEWYRAHRYCGYCGSPTVHHPTERVLSCENCSHHFFPRINPCVIVLVTRGREMLLARSARVRSEFFSCLAGFIEVGETPEETIRREVKEEVGLEVENIRYFKSQSWPFPSQLMLAYFAEYAGGSLLLEEEEIAEAGWYGIDELPTVPSSRISVSGELIQTFINDMRQGRL